jgi:hypothetical protein
MRGPGAAARVLLGAGERVLPRLDHPAVRLSASARSFPGKRPKRSAPGALSVSVSACS